MTKTAVLFFSHVWSRKTLKGYRKLSKAIADDTRHVHLLFHARDDSETQSFPADISLHSFSDQDLATIGFPMFRETIIPGSAHYPLMLFARSNPQYTHYWIIEYDVYFAGNWKRLFDHFQRNDADFLTSHIRRFADEPDWAWWQLAHPMKDISITNRLRSFNPIYRISARALAYIDEAQQSGWTGHFEVLMPTLLEAGGFSLNDFGGSGAFVADGDHNRSYIDDDSDDPKGGLRRGTMRFRPKFKYPGWHRNKLYHPVK